MMKTKYTQISQEDSKYLLNEEKLEIGLPKDWWYSSYSIDAYKQEKKEKVRLFQMNNNSFGELFDKKNKREIQNKPIFDASKGDYIITNRDYLKKDFTYYRKQKERILKYSIYPAVIFALVFTITILSFIAKL